MRFNIQAKPFVQIMMRSFLRLPYHTHPATPAMRTASIPDETFSLSFSLINLMNWGSMDIDVRTPEIIPTNCCMQVEVQRTFRK
jgi:hypothetical protein